MKFNSNALLDNLQSDVRHILLQANQLLQIPPANLQHQYHPEKWSVAQVLEHLNFYSTHYINAIEQKLHLNQTGPKVSFSPGWLGNYFTNLMKPNADYTIDKKMKAQKSALPSSQPDGANVLQKFIQDQHHLLNLLQIAKSANLNYNRIPTTLSKLISLKLGDTFRFFIAHEQRHFLQIQQTLIAINTQDTVEMSHVSSSL